MATETADTEAGSDERSDHVRSILVTSIITLAGVAAGVAAWQLASGATAGDKATDSIGLVTLLGAIVASYVVLTVARIDVGDFSAKDHLFVVFMTFSMWFVTWGVLLSAEAY